MDNALEKQQAALDIVLSTGRLRQCELHPQSVLVGNLEATAPCYGLAMERFKVGELGQFESSDDLVQHIRAILDSFDQTVCPQCTPDRQELRIEVRTDTASKLAQMAQQVGVEEGQIIDCLVEAWPGQPEALDQLAKVFAYRLGTGPFEDLQES